MYNHVVFQQIKSVVSEVLGHLKTADLDFFARLSGNANHIHKLFMSLYSSRPDADSQFAALIRTITVAYRERTLAMKQLDQQKLEQPEPWFISHKLVGMSLYVDRFAGNLEGVQQKLNYLEQLGVNVLHLMPIFKSPPLESDGGYAVEDFREVDERFGTLADLLQLQQQMHRRGMYLMLDIVLNHTSHQHEWAMQAKSGNATYKDFFYFFPDRTIPDQFEATMPEVFPESAPGSFTWVPEVQEWVMTVFHHYQWDLNYTNPAVLVAMLDNILFYANLGVDVLRIDAPAFIWKKLGTTGQNLPEAHTILRLIKLAVQVAAPGMALLGEAIVAPAEIMKYFGEGEYEARECDFAYNATHMALQWDALATGDTRVMLAAQHELLRKPYGTSWITYTRCHDDIGLGYDDYMIRAAGYDPVEHRRFLKDYFSGGYQGSPAVGALFGVNPKTNDARISGSLASLCGLEKAINANDEAAIEQAINKIILMQAHSFFIGGLPMLFYGDELGSLNDYSYLSDEGKSYDNRWMHRPLINWNKVNYTDSNTIEGRVFAATQRLINLRKSLPVVADRSNVEWMSPHNIHVAGYVRHFSGKRLYCVFNFCDKPAWLTWYAFREKGLTSGWVIDYVTNTLHSVGNDNEYLILPAYGYMLLEAHSGVHQ
jgi:amylosucrase